MARAVNPQDRIEGAVLKPANEKFAERRVSRTAKNKSTNIGGPVRSARKRIIQSSRNLPAETEPVRVNIARPRRDSVSLRTGKCRTRQNEHPFLVGRTPLS